jgi:PAS domain-containing protein
MDLQEQYELSVQYLRALFDTIPLPAFIVDGDVRIHDFNNAAEEFLGPEPAAALYRRGGEAFHCIHAGLDGCGRAAACHDCAIRNGVSQALNGQGTHRALHRAMLRRGESTTPVDLLITASLLPYREDPRVLVILEDLSRFMQSPSARPKRPRMRKTSRSERTGTAARR